MIKAAAERGWIDYDRVLMESSVATESRADLILLTGRATRPGFWQRGGWNETSPPVPLSREGRGGT